jgi:hypothetical protein
MKKVSTAAARQSRNISQQKLTIGLDLGDRNRCYCVLDEAGQIQLEQRVRTTVKALREGRSAGCADPGATGEDRSRAVVSGEASQRAGSSRSDGDSGTGLTGASAHGAGQYGPRNEEFV